MMMMAEMVCDDDGDATCDGGGDDDFFNFQIPCWCLLDVENFPHPWHYQHSCPFNINIQGEKDWKKYETARKLKVSYIITMSIIIIL